MIIEIGDNGLRSRYHWRSADIADESVTDYCAASNPQLATVTAVAAYLAIRQLCPFLTTDNHEWEAKDYGSCKPEHRALKDLTQSSRYNIVIYHKPGMEFYAGQRFWFSMAYRVPGEPY